MISRLSCRHGPVTTPREVPFTHHVMGHGWGSIRPGYRFSHTLTLFVNKDRTRQALLTSNVSGLGPYPTNVRIVSLTLSPYLPRIGHDRPFLLSTLNVERNVRPRWTKLFLTLCPFFHSRVALKVTILNRPHPPPLLNVHKPYTPLRILPYSNRNGEGWLRPYLTLSTSSRALQCPQHRHALPA